MVSLTILLLSSKSKLYNLLKLPITGLIRLIAPPSQVEIDVDLDRATLARMLPYTH